MKILDVKKITELRFVNLFSTTYEDRMKNIKQWIFASRSKADNPVKEDKNIPDAVVIVPFHTGCSKLVVIKEFRVPVGGFQYGFPAGLVDPGETIEQAGARELLEETGLMLDRVTKKSRPVYSSSGLSDESVCMLFAECSGEASTRKNEASEDISVEFVSRRQAEQLLNESRVEFDVKTWLVLNTFASYGVI